MMATLVSGCVWKQLFSLLVLDCVFFVMGARNGMLFLQMFFEVLLIYCLVLIVIS